MQKIIEKLLEKIDLSSPLNFYLLIISCVFATCILADFISAMSYARKSPEIVELYHSDIRQQILITTGLISSFFFSIFLSLTRYIDRLRRELANQLRHDSLTGLLTREAFLSDFKKHSVKKNNDAFLIIDADLFKSINDTHGHLAGDKALIQITEALKKGIRNSDAIGRIGGEEFAVHLKNVNYDLALEIAERLRENVKKANIGFELADVDLSVSIGAVVYEENIDLPILMTKADRLLYKAKENGRNRVEHKLINNEAIA